MENQYAYARRMAELCNQLGDQWSKDVFWARLQYDCEPTAEHEKRLFELTGITAEEKLLIHECVKSVSEKAAANGKKLFLYGTKFAGTEAGQLILRQGGDFYAYCARNHEKYTEGVLGKQVFSPNYVFEHPEECYVLLCAAEASEEIYKILMDHDFPEDQVFIYTQSHIIKDMIDRQYFEFPALFPKGKAFVDGGCYNCGTSKLFAEWCGGEYSKIIAFEPDPKNYQQCLAIADNSNLCLKLIPSGLSDRSGTVSFTANGNGGSHIVDSEVAFNNLIGEGNGREVTIQTVALDDVALGTEIGFIKMDIEGAELNALHGAENTILRYKPLLAICVYHRCGDMLAIMDYLHDLVPQYHFWLRHYYIDARETILYASVNMP